MYHPCNYNTPTLEKHIEENTNGDEWSEQAREEIKARENGKPFPPIRDGHDSRDDYLHTGYEANMKDQSEQEERFHNGR